MESKGEKTNKTNEKRKITKIEKKKKTTNKKRNNKKKTQRRKK